MHGKWREPWMCCWRRMRRQKTYSLPLYSVLYLNNHDSHRLHRQPNESSSIGGGTRQPPPIVDGPLSINDELMFSPAEHEDSMKLRKQRKKQRKLEQKLRQLQEQQQLKEQLPPQNPPQPQTPPSARPPKSSAVSQEERTDEEDTVWYAKWWVLCFPEFQIHSKT